ncbi:MAG: 3'-5' exonuclease [Pseudomonadota bacterium]
MQFRIADSFTASLSKLTAQEQKAVKTTAFDLQVNPAHPGLQFHRIERAKDENFWSIRVNRDIRLIVHKTASAMLLAYVDHHDDAYAWAERRRIEVHPKTGAAQLVEIRERIEEQVIYRQMEVAEPAEEAAPLFAHVDPDDLLGYGVPEAWLEDVLAATEESLFDLAEHLPQEAAEALLDLATGKTPDQAPVAEPSQDAFNHPDAQRRFRLLTDAAELQQALDYPWEKWTVFLHPAQRAYVDRRYTGPTRISGSAGTGKTVVALHRAAHLAKTEPDAKILLTTFSKPLANALRIKLERLVGQRPEILDRIHVAPLREVAYGLYNETFGQPSLASTNQLRSLVTEAATGTDFEPSFVLAEWQEVVDAWQLETWEAYRDVPRLGRKTRLGAKQREALWSIVEHVRQALADRKLVTWPGVYHRLSNHLRTAGRRPYSHAIVDEAQDIGVAELAFLAALGEDHDDALFFTGDLGQRIFQQPFSWKAVGVDLRGRSHTLKICYRTSEQIRTQADRLLPAAISDVDGNSEDRRTTVSIFAGPRPELHEFADEVAEYDAVSAYLRTLKDDRFTLDEIGIFVRDDRELKRARRAASTADLPFVQLDDKVETQPNHIAIGTMHLAKGLEFRAVIVMSCDDEVIPQQHRIEQITDAADLDEVYSTERHLLYVACTRARERLWVSGVRPASEFLDDLVTD